MSRLAFFLPSRPMLVLLGVLLIAANLRAPVTGIAPLLELIQADLSLNATAAGLLTAMPLFIFAVVSLLSAALARAVGLFRSLFLAAVLILAGVLLRVLGGTIALFLGMGLLAMGIAIANVLLPSLVKQQFPQRIAFVTSLYVLVMGLVAALNSAVAVPLAELAGQSWRWSSLAIGVIALASVLIWLTQLGADSRQTPPDSAKPATVSGSVWRLPLAWHITLYMGLNSVVYYMIASWLPAMLVSYGFDPEQAGQIHGLMQLCSAVPGLVLLPLLNRLQDQRPVAFAGAALQTLTMLGLLLLPSWSLLWSLLFGFGSGSVFIVALSLIGLRSASAQQAASLSGMAQCVGYLLAACGPPLIGALHDVFGDWAWALGLCLLVTLGMIWAGVLAARPAHRV
ncbi:MFS transporter [Alcaligenes sp. SDU_A2]|uniref:MFS transporter n=1 Tax=Alcaligenes sp. SDU_A2 TaxID=3136634 RepID=UPI002CB873B7|nr:MFS transporter [Alcaligenes sp.]HRL27457.1 MFS transporter [Alcaligenes sp.]